MERDVLLMLEKIANYSYDEWHAGLNAMLNSHEHFARYVDKNYRLSQYDENGDFYMPANEHYFHLIGFMDAIIWLHRTHVFRSRETDCSDVYEPEDVEERAIWEQAIKEEKSVHSFIINFETGE